MAHILSEDLSKALDELMGASRPETSALDDGRVTGMEEKVPVQPRDV